MSQRDRTKEGDVLERVCWKHYGAQAGAVEAVLEANTNLAEHGEVLPAGLEIILPDLVLPETERLIRLWD